MNKFKLLYILPIVFTSCLGAGEDFDDDGARDDALEGLSEFGELMEKKFTDSELPYTCDINFDNFDWEADNYLNEEEFRLMELYMIFPEGFVENRYSALDRIELESGIKLVIISEELGEHELSTYLVTYSENEWYVSNVRLAYDEIAEGFLRIESIIEGDMITRTTSVYIDEGPLIETERYFIQSDGTIVWEKDLETDIQ